MEKKMMIYLKFIGLWPLARRKNNLGLKGHLGEIQIYLKDTPASTKIFGNLGSF